jgi:tRNA 2-selenouridine synthase
MTAVESIGLNAEDFLQLDIPTVDVRAPIEFNKGHIPGALNVPLLTNEDRHRVGLCYRQNGHHAAVHLGLQLVGPRMAELAKSGLDAAKDGHIAVYCQRGGQRSQSMCWLWKQMGLTVYRLEGGYKSFRRWSNEILTQPREFLLLAGSTGVGKTAYLHRLIDAGEKVIDLEGLAHHKGSAFGAIGESASPTQSHFENTLAIKLWEYKLTEPIWLESESRRVGTCQIPSVIWSSMERANRIYIERELSQRIERLCTDYRSASIAELERALHAIRKRLGPEAYKNALQDLHADYREGVVKQVLGYYDRLYDRHKIRHQSRILATLDVSTLSEEQIISYLKSVKDEKYPQTE